MNELADALRTQAAVTTAAPQLAKLNKACQGMEAAFMKTLVTQMRSSAGHVAFGQQLGGDVYQDMFDDQLANMLAEKSGTGLGQQMAAPFVKQVMALAMNKKVASK